MVLQPSGVQIAKTGDARQAVDLSCRAIELKPDYIRRVFILGDRAQGPGQVAPEAAAAYRRALEIRTLEHAAGRVQLVRVSLAEQKGTTVAV